MNEDNRVRVASLGGIEAVLDAMGAHPKGTQGQDNGCLAGAGQWPPGAQGGERARDRWPHAALQIREAPALIRSLEDLEMLEPAGVSGGIEGFGRDEG